MGILEDSPKFSFGHYDRFMYHGFLPAVPPALCASLLHPPLIRDERNRLEFFGQMN